MESDSSNLEFTFHSNTYQVDIDKIERLSLQIRSILGVDNFHLDIGFVSPEEMMDLNSEFRDKDKSTDVLSFPQHEFRSLPTVEDPSKHTSPDGPPLLLGDIAISLEDAFNNAKEINQELDREVCFLIVHGILHLCGHDHMEPKEEELMLAQQKTIMKALEDSEPPPAIWQNCARLKV